VGSTLLRNDQVNQHKLLSTVRSLPPLLPRGDQSRHQQLRRSLHHRSRGIRPRVQGLHRRRFHSGGHQASETGFAAGCARVHERDRDALAAPPSSSRVPNRILQRDERDDPGVRLHGAWHPTRPSLQHGQPRHPVEAAVADLHRRRAWTPLPPHWREAHDHPPRRENHEHLVR